ncbi:hypothetical protein FTUN_8319 [Frigoriglobus tundricola]|uniref:Uncharacterized protein n=1 Tax=Frigoriglobus tundricola TaxID=2774151 RepID=A0A6M5Z4G9_9BACT|nr:hypothetical protein FTUN_8319 [Frigoriglobus tundricola]
MWKIIGIGCGVVVALGVAVTVAALVFVPRLFDFAQKKLAEEQERQAIAAAWDAPDRGAAPAQVFPLMVKGYRLDRADDRADVPELNLDVKGAHAVYSAGASRVEVFAYPVSKLEAEALMARAERAYEQDGERGVREFTSVDIEDSYGRVYLSAPGLGQSHLWFTKGWLLVFRTPDAEDREAFVREFLRTPRRQGGV